MLSGILPAWVEPDPLRARATDALALQAVADRLADRLVPGISVLTTRARYFTFLAWVRHRIGKEHNELQIHRHEIALAFTEALLTDKDSEHAKTCQFVGSRNVRAMSHSKIPKDPRQVYKVPAWRAYRASMAALGLINEGPTYSLTDVGLSAASSFGHIIRNWKGLNSPFPAQACLSEVSKRERIILRELLGLSIRGRIDPGSTEGRVRRAAFAREVRKIFDREPLSPEIVLPKYENRRGRELPEPFLALREAAIWERLSLGLNSIFTLWARAVDAGRQRAIERSIEDVLQHGFPPPVMEAVDLTDEDTAIARGISSIRLAIRLSDQLSETGVQLPDKEAFELGRIFIAKNRRPRARVAEGLAMLLARHRAAKGDDVWVREAGSGRLEIAREPGEGWIIPEIVRPHAYRMAAFDQIILDLGGI